MEKYILQDSTIWSFKNRGSWATHKGSYRGNWSPHIPRNLILRYTKKSDWVLDQFLGSGTTLIEAKLLDRNAIGIDINPESIRISKMNLKINNDSNSKILIYNKDARLTSFIRSSAIDFICSHPPYANVIKYSENIKGDLSLMDVDEFLRNIRLIAAESFRVLKKGKFCAVMIGDIRKNGKIIPIGFELLNIYLNAGFSLKEIIIKEQHNCKRTQFWKNKKRDFLLLAHEYIFVFLK